MSHTKLGLHVIQLDYVFMLKNYKILTTYVYVGVTCAHMIDVHRLGHIPHSRKISRVEIFEVDQILF